MHAVLDSHVHIRKASQDVDRKAQLDGEVLRRHCLHGLENKCPYSGRLEMMFGNSGRADYPTVSK